MIQLEEGPLPIPARRHDRSASSHTGSDHTHENSPAPASTAYPSCATSSLTIREAQGRRQTWPCKRGLGFDESPAPKASDVADKRPYEDELDRPVAEHLIRQAEIAARCVRRFRHTMSV